MKVKCLRALIFWTPPEDGGRQTLPDGARYSTVSRFDEDPLNSIDDAWSVVITFEKSPVLQGNPSLGSIRFLSEEAPHAKLHMGAKLQLYEGGYKVAEVKILDDLDATSQPA